MRFFDAHCDSVINALEGDLDFVRGTGSGHIDLPRLLAADVRVQILAVFTSLGYRPDPAVDLRAYAERAIATIQDWAEAADGRLRFALTAADIREAVETSPLDGSAAGLWTDRPGGRRPFGRPRRQPGGFLRGRRAQPDPGLG